MDRAPPLADVSFLRLLSADLSRILLLIPIENPESRQIVVHLLERRQRGLAIVRDGLIVGAWNCCTVAWRNPASKIVSPSQGRRTKSGWAIRAI